MILELIFLSLLVLGLCVLFYRGAVHEFQILQKDYEPEMNWSEVLSEELPLVIRGLPRNWIGGWSDRITGKRTWKTVVRDPETGRKMRTSWANFVATPAPRPILVNSDEISEASRLPHTLSNWRDDGFSRWSWLPTPVSVPTPDLLSAAEFRGVAKTTAEFTALVATDGAPLEIWLAHEGAIPPKVAEDLVGKDPWIQTTNTIPWIDEVKYVEIKLRPGNALVIPRHWWVALRGADDDAAGANTWYWRAEFHTPISLAATALGTKLSAGRA